MKPDQSFGDVLAHAAVAHAPRGFTFQDATGVETTLRYPELLARVQSKAASLYAAGIRKADVVALIEIDPQAFVECFLALLWLGAIAVPMYPPTGMGASKNYGMQALGILGRARARYAVVFDKLLERLQEYQPLLGALELISARSLEQAHPPAPAVQVFADDVAFLQFTSGSTSDPKGVIVTHRTLIANAHGIAGALDVVAESDVCVSWLPLYHDMGLIGCTLTPVATGIRGVLVSTINFARNPAIWCDTMHRHRATITFAPNFGYALACQRTTPEQRRAWDLSTVRVAGCGAEPISARTLRRFCESFQVSGFSPTALTPAYGLAEATLAVTMKTVRTEMRTERSLTEVGGQPLEPLEIVSCGRPLADHFVEIRREDGSLQDDGAEGEIYVRGPSVTPGYWHSDEATRRVFSNGWLRTGDLGFVKDGELFVTGRCKDLLIIRGRNLHPQSIEWEVTSLSGVRPGGAVAFGCPSDEGEGLVVAVEAKERDPADLGSEIRARVQGTFSVALSDVVIVTPGMLPKTTSGKVQRARTRDLYLSGKLSSAAGGAP